MRDAVMFVAGAFCLASVALSAPATQPANATYQLKATLPRWIAWGYYDAAAKPVLRIKSGDSVEIQTLLTNSPAGLRRAGVPAEQIEQALRDIYAQVKDKGPGGHILTGLIYVEGGRTGRCAGGEDSIDQAFCASLRLQRVWPAVRFSAGGFHFTHTKIVPLDEKCDGGPFCRMGSMFRSIRSSGSMGARRRPRRGG